MITLIAFVFVLSLLVLVHELGHFTIAKIFGIGVERFSIGLPPKLVGIKIGDTEYCLSAIPFGGYVKLIGQDDFSQEEDDSPPGPRDYRGKSTPVKIAVLSAGSIMNLLTGLVIFFLLFALTGIPLSSTKIGAVEPGSIAAQLGLKSGDVIVMTDGKKVKKFEEALLPLYTNKQTVLTVKNAQGEERQVTFARKLGENEDFGIIPFYEAIVGKVIKGMPAEKAGIKARDVIASIDTVKVTGWYHMSEIIRDNPGKQLTVTVRRDGKEEKILLTTETASEQQPNGAKKAIGKIGVQIGNERVGAIESFRQAYSRTVYFATQTFGFFGKLITGQMSAKLLGGPVMIAQLAGESAKIGIASLMSFTAFISINLGVLNLLPFPVLDGGHIFILAAETVVRRKLSLKVRMALQQAGTLILLFLMLYVTFNDVMRFETISNIFGGK
ncbi:MAG: RIP metalloprotease RseP [Candidatus Latescibacter sp.]|nr:RIP metalloprotease RseP [Candidatus Latescibacter sp.]